MSTVERDARAHPDAEWLRSVRAALDEWERQPSDFPTSSVLGSGAVAAAEAAFSALHGGRPALLLPSATYGLRAALAAVGVGPGDEVLCPDMDWPASAEAVRTLGAAPVWVPVDPATLTIDPAAAAERRTSRTRAIVACHLLGICADVPALRELLPGVPVVEDCAQALGSTLDGMTAGTMGDAAVLSLGPGKQCDAGEAGVLLCRDRTLHRRAVAATAHPARQVATGIATPAPAFAMRPHPVAAVLALAALRDWETQPVIDVEPAVAALAATAVATVGDHRRRSSRQPFVVARCAAAEAPASVRAAPTGATAFTAHARALLNTTCVATVAA